MIDIIGFCDSADSKAAVFSDDIALNLEGNGENCN